MSVSEGCVCECGMRGVCGGVYVSVSEGCVSVNVE